MVSGGPGRSDPPRPVILSHARSVTDAEASRPRGGFRIVKIGHNGRTGGCLSAVAVRCSRGQASPVTVANSCGRKRCPCDPGVMTFGPRGQAFYDQVTGSYGVSESELHLLTETCRCLDTLDDLDRAVRTDGVMALGSKDQTVVNPAVSEARAQRLALRSLLAALAIPGEDGETVPTARRTSAKAAAAARWSSRPVG